MNKEPNEKQLAKRKQNKKYYEKKKFKKWQDELNSRPLTKAHFTPNENKKIK